METTDTKANYATLDNVFGAEFMAKKRAAEELAQQERTKKAAAKAKKGKTVAQMKTINKQSAKEGWTTSVLRQADKLSVAREKYENETLARSNKELYGILSEVYKLFNDAVCKECLREVVNEMREKLTKRGVRVQKNTNAITVFVRYVFNSDRKRAYNYASTLMAALQAKIEADKLADFIEGKNGVEECKKEFRKKEETLQKEAALKYAVETVCADLRSMKAQKVVKLAGIEAELAEDTDFVFVVARKSAKGELELLQAVSRTTVALQNIAVKELAKYTLETGKQLSKLETVIADVSNGSFKYKKKLNSAADAAEMTLDELEYA